MPPTQLSVFVTLTVRPADLAALLAAHRPLWAACAAEPECLFFDAFADPARPGRVRFVEVWAATREWFDTKQMTKPYYDALWTHSKPLWTEDVQIEYFERLGEGAVVREGYLAGSTKMD